MHQAASMIVSITAPTTKPFWAHAYLRMVDNALHSVAAVSGICHVALLLLSLTRLFVA
jgi:hypothetical protein